jgi:hypothetical protein
LNCEEREELRNSLRTLWRRNGSRRNQIYYLRLSGVRNWLPDEGTDAREIAGGLEWLV